MLSLPATPHGITGAMHLYRAPWDIVTSAFWYHSQQSLPASEAGWLNKPVSATSRAVPHEAADHTTAGMPHARSTCRGSHPELIFLPPWFSSPYELQASDIFEAMVAGGVDQQVLDVLGVTSNNLQKLPFRDLLLQMPEQEAVQLQFWQSLPELYTMARQYLIFKQLPGVVQVRFEDAKSNLTAALLPVLSEFYPKVGAAHVIYVALQKQCQCVFASSE